MTETLTRLLHDRADAARLDPIDLDAVTRGGTRAVRRRRWTGVTAAVAGVAVVAAVGAVGLGGGSRGSSDVVAPPPSAEPTLSWAEGSTLHVASRTTDGWSWDFTADLGHPIAQYVATADGYVFSDGKAVFSYTDGPVEPVGEVRSDDIDGSRLVSDSDGSLAAWPDGDHYVVLDQATGRLTQVSLEGEQQPHLVAVDDRTLYFMGSQEATAVDVDTQQATALETVNNSHLSLVAAEDGTLLSYDRKGDPVMQGRPLQMTLELGPPDVASLSPDGSRLVGGSGVFPGPATYFEFDGAYRGHRGELPTASYLAYPYAWVDDDTVALLTMPEKGGHYQLVTCTFPKAGCQVVVADLGEGLEGGPVNATTFVLPTGMRYLQAPPA